jgi:hypothetical protein
MTTKIPPLTDDEMASAIGKSHFFTRPFPDPQSGPAFEAYVSAVRALHAYTEEMHRVAADERLSATGKAALATIARTAAEDACAKAAGLVERGGGRAFELRRDFLAQVGPQDAREIGRFAAIWAHAGHVPPERLERMPFVSSPPTVAEIEELRATYDAPLLLGFLPKPELRQRAEQVMAEALGTPEHEQWIALTEQLAMADKTIHEVRSYLRTDATLSDTARRARDADEAHRRALFLHNQQRSA